MTAVSFSLRTASLAMAAALLSLSAQAEQKLLPAQSEIAFASKQMGVTVDGHFKKFDAKVAFDPAKPDASKIAFSIDTGSATVGIARSTTGAPTA